MTPSGSTGSTVPRRQLGRYLRDLRSRSRLTVKAAAMSLEWSEAKIWRIETGHTSLRSLDVEAMCKVYDAPADLTEALMALAKETKARGWWHSYGDVIPEGFDLYIGLEEAASSLWWYESELIPGLFQTAEYARTLIRADNSDVAEEEIERRVDLRMARQTLLARSVAAPQLRVVLNEAVLRRPIGGGHVMKQQLERLIDIGDLPNVTLRVSAFEMGLHHGVMTGPFVLMEFPRNGQGNECEPPTIYAENLAGALYLDKPHEVDRYRVAFTRIWDAALDEHTSKALITEVAGDYA
ncbi:XRE family transcriptional regulator [Spongiactinospora rosea]|uniref:XRE family transcriptional regulator n=1 Tax=Spongiactinospora rosea TaxID=2248750 RepID=A0A366M3D7_9ACTN|nr:helix-turn-helix transcriptional regulator [Spongiactinospora rosea]RBQ20758.1 XRE family transcriptional regulator [Spongiactinospora rosea]